MNDDIEFQGRTNVVGNANATAFSVLAIRHNGTTVQVNCLSVQFCIHKMKTSDIMCSLVNSYHFTINKHIVSYYVP